MKNLTILFLFLSVTSFAQNMNSWGLKVSNNITGKPVVKYPQLFYTNFHPGIEFEYNWSINKNTKHQLYASANLGAYYHRFMHTGLKIYPEFNYNYQFAKKWSALVDVGGGYLHSFENVAALELNNDGAYEKVNRLKGRPQFLFGFEVGFTYTLDKLNQTKIFCSFGSFMQGPFVSGYVPLLPYNNFNIGARIPLQSKEK